MGARGDLRTNLPARKTLGLTWYLRDVPSSSTYLGGLKILSRHIQVERSQKNGMAVPATRHKSHAVVATREVQRVLMDVHKVLHEDLLMLKSTSSKRAQDDAVRPFLSL